MSSSLRVRATNAALLGALLAAPAVALADAPMEAQLLEVVGDSVKLNKGGSNGVSVGQIFDLYQEAQVYVLPLSSSKVPLVKSQRRVARIQIYQVEPSTAKGRFLSHSVGSDGKKVPLQPQSLRALHNPTAIAPNRKPVFLGLPTYKPTAWGEDQRIWLKISNEPDDDVVYTWRVTGGRLSSARTIRPSNVWTAPATAGKYQLSVTVQDSAGNTNQTALTLTSSGVNRSSSPTRWPAVRLYGTFSRYSRVRDMAFDNLGRKFFLDSKGGWGGYCKVRVEKANGRFIGRPLDIEDKEFSSVAVQGWRNGVPGALFAIDEDTKTILRYDFASVSWEGLFKRAPLTMGHPDGGTGNARFEEPVDLAISNAGEVYVLDAAQGCVQVFEVKTNKEKEAQGVFLVSFGRPGQARLELQKPVAMALGRDNSVYVLDNGRKTVVVYRGWRPVFEFSAGTQEEDLAGIAVDPFSNDVFVLERKKGAVIQYSRNGTLKGRFGENSARGHPARLKEPTRIRMDPTRVLWVSDRSGASVVRFDARDGKFLGRTGGIEFGGPLRIAGAPTGGFVALDKEEFQVTCFDRQGWITARFGEEGAKAGKLQQPIDVAVTRTGDVFVLDARKKGAQRYSPGGAFLSQVGSGGQGRFELMEVKDLTATADARHLTFVQQREKWNFNLFVPGTGKSALTFGEYTGELAPRFGCVTQFNGEVAKAKPWYWTVDEDRERVYLTQGRGVDPTALKVEFDGVTDIEPAADDTVFVTDPGDERIVVFDPKGNLKVELKSKYFEEPWDVGIDGLGHVYVYDKSTRRIVRLAPRK